MVSTICTDAFTRADGSADGSTLDNANGGSETDTWSKKTGTWNIASNKLKQTASGADEIIVVGSTAAVDVQRVTATLDSTLTLNPGAVARWNVGSGGQGNYYMSYLVNATTMNLYRRDNGGFTQIGTGSITTVVAGDKLSVDVSGSSIQGMINGSVVLGPVTDSTYTTGLPGLYCGGNANLIFDDFKYEGAATTSAAAGRAQATGTAYGAAASLAPNSGAASGTGTAQSPAGSVALSGGLASATGTSQSPAASLATTAGLTSATGTARAPTPSVAVNAGLTSATGTAQSPTITTSAGDPTPVMVTVVEVNTVTVRESNTITMRERP